MALTPPPTTPLRTMSQAVFDACMAARMAWEVAHTTELDALQLDVTTKQATATAAAATATTKAAEASASAGTASTKAAEAAQSKADAETAALLAQNQGASVTATSVTSLTVSAGAKSLTVQTGKQFQVDAYLTIANGANVMHGQVVSYNAATGALAANITSTKGAGTFVSWNVSLAGAQGAAGTLAGNASGAINDKSFGSIASAATLNLQAADGNYGHVTGSTGPITAVTLADGAERECTFDGTPIISLGASLIGPTGGSSIAVQAGDIVRFRGETAGVVRIVSFQRKSGAALVGGSGGAVEVTSSTDITLTVNSERVQVVKMTAAGKRVLLPAGTTLDEGGPTFITSATFDSFPYTVHDSAGNFLLAVPAGQAAHNNLVDNTTAAGKWLSRLLSAVFSKISKTTNGTTSYGGSPADDVASMDAVLLSPTLGITCFHYGGALYLVSWAVTPQGTSFLNGMGVANSTSGPRAALARFDATHGVVFYYSTDNTRDEAMGFTVNATTGAFTGSTAPISLGMSGSPSIRCAEALSATLALVSVWDSSVPVGKIIAVSANGGYTTLTLGGTLSGASFNNYNVNTYIGIGAISATEFLAAYNTSPGRLTTLVCTMSGTTPVAGNNANAVVTGTATGSGIVNHEVCMLSSTRAIVRLDNNWICGVNISGSTNTQGTPQSISGDWQGTESVKLAKLTSGKAMLAGALTGGPMGAQTVTWDGTTLVRNALNSTINGIGNMNTSYPALTDSQNGTDCMMFFRSNQTTLLQESASV